MEGSLAEQLQFSGARGGGRAVVHAELREDAAGVLLDRLRRDEEPGGDLRISQARREVMQNLPFSGSQWLGQIRSATTGPIRRASEQGQQLPDVVGQNVPVARRLEHSR